MPDPDSSPPFDAATHDAEYLIGSQPATASLEAVLRKSISEIGPISFTDFMSTALYHPDLGYYARATRQVGRRGDFFTSVSVGPVFGNLLARRFLREWHALGSPERWRIVECGAHDGTLAADVLAALEDLNASAFSALEYVIIEPLPLLRQAQAEILRVFPNFTSASSPSEISYSPLPGVVFGNELLDALPFHVVESGSGSWRECRVGLSPGGEFEWQLAAIDDPQLLSALLPLGRQFPENYRTEIRTNVADFLRPLLSCISSGILVWPDYGFARPEYYHPDRHQGTLRTFSNHRTGENPLRTPGEIDITAHVDFTSVAGVAIDLGCRPLAFRSQGTWLTEIGRDWLLSLEGRPQPQALRQFQTLTHASHLGGSFHVLELAWNLPPARMASESDFHRLALMAK